MLATRLHYLFAIDPDWVGEHMIPRLDPGSSEEACDLWSAYGWSPTVGPDLLRAFKEPFRNLSTTLRHRRFLFTDSFLLLWKWRVG